MGGEESMETIATYCIVDSLLTIGLVDPMNIWVSITEMSIVTRTQIQDLYTRGQHIKLISQLFK